MAGYLSSRGGDRSPCFSAAWTLAMVAAAIGLALAVEPLLMGAEIGDPRLDLGLEVVPQVGTDNANRLRYRPWRFHEHF